MFRGCSLRRGGCRVEHAAERATYRDVFAVAEFRALWLAQVLSVGGDQLARVALTVLVYDRTRSALLAAVTFVCSIVPSFLGGIALSGLADRLPRRSVMIACDLLRGVLVVIMVLPGMPVAALIVLLFLVTLVGAPFQSARSATMPDVLGGDRYVLGTAVTLTTLLLAQFIGFAVGGVLVSALGVRTSLLADAVTFAASALLIRVWVRARPAARHQAGSPVRGGLAGGLRLVLGNPALRTPMLFGWLAAFYDVPEGVAAPLSSSLHSGSVAVGLILAAGALGAGLGAVTFSRLVSPGRRLRLMPPLAIACCTGLILLATRPGLGAADPAGVRAAELLPDSGQRSLRDRSAPGAARPGVRPGPGWDEPGPGHGHDPGRRRRRAFCPRGRHRGDGRARRGRRHCHHVNQPPSLILTPSR